MRTGRLGLTWTCQLPVESFAAWMAWPVMERGERWTNNLSTFVIRLAVLDAPTGMNRLAWLALGIDLGWRGLRGCPDK